MQLDNIESKEEPQEKVGEKDIECVQSVILASVLYACVWNNLYQAFR